MTLNFILNGRPTELEVSPDKRLLDLLREDLGLTGTKEGCGEGECGACTVIIDGEAMHSCLVLACQLEGKERPDHRRSGAEWGAGQDPEDLH